MTLAVQWSLVGRYALLTSLSQLIPVPLVDGWVEDALRRRLFTKLAAAAGVELPAEVAGVLADTPSSGCLGWVLAALWWPVKKLLKSVVWVFTAKAVVDAFSRDVHRALMVHEAVERGWLPHRADEVRVAMDRALGKADVRVLERSLMGVFRDHRDSLNGAVWHATRKGRAVARGSRADAVAADLEAAGISGASNAMIAALRTHGVLAEVLHFFLAAMGEAATEHESESASGEPDSRFVSAPSPGEAGVSDA